MPQSYFGLHLYFNRADDVIFNITKHLKISIYSFNTEVVAICTHKHAENRHTDNKRQESQQRQDVRMERRFCCLISLICAALNRGRAGGWGTPYGLYGYTRHAQFGMILSFFPLNDRHRNRKETLGRWVGLDRHACVALS